MVYFHIIINEVLFGRPVFKLAYINSLIYQILTTQAYDYLPTVWIRLAVL